MHISSPRPSFSPGSFLRTKAHHRRLRSNLAHSHSPIACYCFKRISPCIQHGKSIVGTTRCQSRTFTRPLRHSSSRPLKSEWEPCRRLVVRGRESSRARSKHRTNTSPRLPVRWSIFPGAGARARPGTFLPPRVGRGRKCHRLRESRGWTGRCLCALLGLRWIGLGGCTREKRRRLGISSLNLTACREVIIMYEVPRIRLAMSRGLMST